MQHIPIGSSIVPHDVHTTGYMRVAVIAADVVHTLLVYSAAFGDAGVEAISVALHLFSIEDVVPSRSTEGKIITPDTVRTSEVKDETLAVADTHVTNEGKEPRDEG